MAASVEIGERTCDASYCFGESLRIITETGIEAERARTLREWAIYAEHQGEQAQAKSMLEEAEAVFQRLDMPLEIARTRELLVN